MEQQTVEHGAENDMCLNNNSMENCHIQTMKCMRVRCALREIFLNEDANVQISHWKHKFQIER